MSSPTSSKSSKGSASRNTNNNKSKSNNNTNDKENENQIITTSSSSAADSSSSVQDLGTTHDLLHSLMMVVLYISQGMNQGSLGVCTTLMLTHKTNHLTMSEQSLLTLPFYAFSFKFLWAPFVDCLYFRKNSRRPLWIIWCQ